MKKPIQATYGNRYQVTSIYKGCVVDLAFNRSTSVFTLKYVDLNNIIWKRNSREKFDEFSSLFLQGLCISPWCNR